MKWEYLQALCGGKFSNTVWVDGIFDDDHLTSFDQLGQRNWELIAVSNDVAYFKRPIPEWLRNDHPTGGITEAKFREFIRSYVKELMEKAVSE